MIIVLCDRCGLSCQNESLDNGVRIDEANEYAEFTAKWGYFSNRDLENWDYLLCEKCAVKVRDWIQEKYETLAT